MNRGSVLANLILSLKCKEANGDGSQSLVRAVVLSMGKAIFDVTREEVLGTVRVWQPM